MEAAILGDATAAQLGELVAAQVADREGGTVGCHADGQHAMLLGAHLGDAAVVELADVDQTPASRLHRMVVDDGRQEARAVDTAFVRVVAKVAHRAVIPER